MSVPIISLSRSRRLMMAVWALIALLGCAAGNAFAQTAETTQSRVEQLDAFVEQAVSDWNMPGLAIAVVKDGKTVLAKGYGRRSVDRVDPVDEHTLFCIGSTTKAMTAALLGSFVDEDRLGWDDPVISHWPGFLLKNPVATREVTVRDLLTHRAGLGNSDAMWYGRNRSRQDILDNIRHIEPVYSLRSNVIYQNVMYLVAGHVAERIGDASWERLMRDRLFEPLGMSRTRATTTSAEQADNVAQPHAVVDDQIVEIENEILDAVAPAGAVWSSASEMSKWLNMLLSGGEHERQQVLSSPTVAELLRPQQVINLTQFYPYVASFKPHWMTYALGWFQLDYKGRAISLHSGSIDGMAAMVGLVPDENLGVVVLTNLNGSHLRHAVLWKCMDLFASDADSTDWSGQFQQYEKQVKAASERQLERMQDTRQVDAPPTHKLNAFTGVYEHAANGRVEITLNSGGLRMNAGARRRATLEHWHHNTFRARADRRWQPDSSLNFRLRADGVVDAMVLDGVVYTRLLQAEQHVSQAD